MIYMSSLIKTRCPVNFSYYHFFPVRQELSTCKLDLRSPEVDVFHSKAEWHDIRLVLWVQVWGVTVWHMGSLLPIILVKPTAVP